MARNLWVLVGIISACNFNEVTSVAIDTGPARAQVQLPAEADQYRPPEMPNGWGDFVTVGGTMYINFSDFQTQNLVPVMELPRRFHQNAKKQHRYSKWNVDIEKRMAAETTSQDQMRPDKGAEKHRRLSFITTPTLLPLSSWFPRPAISQKPPHLFTYPVPFSNPRPAGIVGVYASGGGLGFGSNQNKGKDKKKEKDGSKSGLSKAREAQPGAFPEVEMQFTCNKCEKRQAKRFTRQAYEEGVVIVTCEGCGVKHLIADNQGYFQDWTGSKSTNVEKMLEAKGEQVDNRLSPLTQRPDGTLEMLKPDEQP